MKLLWELGLLFGICLAGSGISAILPFPFPSSVSAMVLLFVLLLFKILRPAQLETVCGFLQKNMGILFIPSAAGVITSIDVLAPVLWQVLLICIITTVLTFGVTQWTVRAVIALQNRRKVGGGVGEAR